jgi:uncharacterized small protein (TIGR04563 family)
MTGSDRRKQSLYFPEEMLDEIARHADRLDRSLSWVVQAAWRTARRNIMAMPSATEDTKVPITAAIDGTGAAVDDSQEFPATD